MIFYELKQVLLFKLRGGSCMRRFFKGKAIGTIILFIVLVIYLLLKYVLQLF